MLSAETSVAEVHTNIDTVEYERLYAGFMALFIPILLASTVYGDFSLPWAAGLFAATAVLLYPLAKFIMQPIEDLAKESKDVIDNPLIQMMYTGRKERSMRLKQP